ncbi:MAG: helicase-related protein [Euryarchaeota archaeon]|nr:helicase-related protein [Euryarchaeota archaeon]
MNNTSAPNIIDNSPNRELISVLKDQIKKSKETKLAIGYFFLSGFCLVKDDFPDSYENLPFLKIVMGDETTYLTKKELVAGYNLRELFKQRMIEDLQKRKISEDQIEQLRTLKEFVANNIIDIKLYDESRLHAKLYLFLTDPDEKYTSPGLAIAGSSNFTAEGLTKNKELNVLLTSREDVFYLNQWFDTLWDDALEFREDLIKVIDYSGILPESPYPKIGTLIDPQTLFKYLVYQWFEGRVLNLLKRDILMEFQIVGVMNAVNIINFYNGVILADSVGLGKSFMASAVIEEFLNGKHPNWLANHEKEPSVLLILPPSIISQWEELLLNSDYFFKDNKKELRSEYPMIYEICDDSGEELLGKIAFLSLGIFQNMKEGEVDRLAEKYDLFVIDESHRFRNKNTNRWKNARKLQKKGDNFPNKFMLLTATPLNNSIDDIFNLIRIFIDDTFAPFRIKGIPITDLVKQYRDLKKELRKRDDDKIRKDTKKVATEIKQKILDEIMVSRVRKYIMEQFKDIKVDGKPLVFKDPKPFSLEYSPFYTRSYRELIDLVSGKIDSILFEYTKLYGSRFVVFESVEDEENGKHYIEIADLFKLLLGKRLESGIYPFETTLRRIYEKEKMFYKIFKIQMNTILSEDSLRKIIKDTMEKAKIKKELEEVSEEYNVEERDEETWYDRLVKILLEYSEDLKEEGKEYTRLEELKLGLNKILQNLENDLRIIDGIIEKLNAIKEEENGGYKTFGKIPKEEDIIELPIYRYVSDPKLNALKQIIGDPSQKSDKLKNIASLNRKKIIIFTQYKDTAYYLYHNLLNWAGKETGLHTWLKDAKIDRIKIGLVTGDTDTSTKINYLKRFAPLANNGYEEVERYGELEVLISTDALSEGVNIQDADAVVNYDLPWNPMVIVQRVGRVNRIGNEKDVYVVNFMPSSEIEVIVGILSKLKEKISDITLVVGKETKILSPDEEITVETFGEKIKDYSQLSITELEQYGISEDFEKFLPEGMPQEQVDEYKLSNIIQ